MKHGAERNTRQRTQWQEIVRVKELDGWRCTARGASGRSDENGDGVGDLQEFGESADALDAHGLVRAGRRVGIEEDDAEEEVTIVAKTVNDAADDLAERLAAVDGECDAVDSLDDAIVGSKAGA